MNKPNKNGYAHDWKPINPKEIEKPEQWQAGTGCLLVSAACILLGLVCGVCLILKYLI